MRKISDKIMMASLAVLALFLWNQGVCAKEIGAVGSPAPNFVLRDQNGKTVDLSSLKGKIAVICGSGQEGSKDNGIWGEAIGKRYGDKLIYLAAADLQGIPPLFRFFALQSVKKTSLNIPLLLDWDGQIFKAYGLVPKVKYPLTNSPREFIINIQLIYC